ncbi:hypothetical protein ABH940_002290 [Streptacidiphilus sp. BW17]
MCQCLRRGSQAPGWPRPCQKCRPLWAEEGTAIPPAIDPGKSRADLPLGVQVVRTVARSTWTPRGKPAPRMCGSTADGMATGTGVANVQGSAKRHPGEGGISAKGRIRALFGGPIGAPTLVKGLSWSSPISWMICMFSQFNQPHRGTFEQRISPYPMWTPRSRLERFNRAKTDSGWPLLIANLLCSGACAVLFLEVAKPISLLCYVASMGLMANGLRTIYVMICVARGETDRLAPGCTPAPAEDVAP